MCLPATLALRGSVKEFDPLLWGQSLPGSLAPSGKHHPDHFSSRNPLQLVARSNAIDVGNGLWDGQLQFAGDLGHFLTIARIESLLNPKPKGLAIGRLFPAGPDLPSLALILVSA
jgi:hypothetical protein